MSAVGPAFFNFIKKLEENGDKLLPAPLAQQQPNLEFEFNNSTCYVCNGYYGPSFGEPVCVTCHAFLFPDFPVSYLPSSYFNIEKTDDRDSGNDEPSDLIYSSDRKLNRVCAFPQWFCERPQQTNAIQMTSPEDEASRPSISHSGAGASSSATDDAARPGRSHASATDDAARPGRSHASATDDDVARPGRSHASATDDAARPGRSHASATDDVARPGRSHASATDDVARPGRSHASATDDVARPGRSHASATDDVARPGRSHASATDDHARPGRSHASAPGDVANTDGSGSSTKDVSKPGQGPGCSSDAVPKSGRGRSSCSDQGSRRYHGPEPTVATPSLVRSLQALSTPRLCDNLEPGQLEQLPSEVLLCIFSYLDDLSLCACARVCARWRRLVLARAPAPRWAAFLARRWPLYRPVQPVLDWHKKYQELVDSSFCLNCLVQMCVQAQPTGEEGHWRRHRLHSELKMLRNDPPEGIMATPFDAKCCHWQASVTGPVGSPYEGGVFYLYVQVPYAYPMNPPVVRFLTRILHPNVSRHGDVGIDSVQHNWTLALTISKVLISIQSLLTDPYTAVCMEPELGELYVRDRTRFEALARLWTWRYAMNDVLV